MVVVFGVLKPITNPGTQPSAAGCKLVASRCTKNLLCKLAVIICTKSPFCKHISSSVIAVYEQIQLAVLGIFEQKDDDVVDEDDDAIDDGLICLFNSLLFSLKLNSLNWFVKLFADVDVNVLFNDVLFNNDETGDLLGSLFFLTANCGFCRS